jgi:hypothetical protein
MMIDQYFFDVLTNNLGAPDVVGCEIKARSGEPATNAISIAGTSIRGYRVQATTRSEER